MLIVQILLLLSVLAVLLVLGRRVHTVRIRALKRVAFLVFMAATVYGILRPGDTTWLANKVGVGRGADLLLYCLAIAFFAFVVNTYLRFRNLELRFAELVRAVALRDAQPPAAEHVAVAAEPVDVLQPAAWGARAENSE